MLVSQINGEFVYTFHSQIGEGARYSNTLNYFRVQYSGYQRPVISK